MTTIDAPVSGDRPRIVSMFHARWVVYYSGGQPFLVMRNGVTAWSSEGGSPSRLLAEHSRRVIEQAEVK